MKFLCCEIVFVLQFNKFVFLSLPFNMYLYDVDNWIQVPKWMFGFTKPYQMHIIALNASFLKRKCIPAGLNASWPSEITGRCLSSQVDVQKSYRTWQSAYLSQSLKPRSAGQKKKSVTENHGSRGTECEKSVQLLRGDPRSDRSGLRIGRSTWMSGLMLSPASCQWAPDVQLGTQQPWHISHSWQPIPSEPKPPQHPNPLMRRGHHTRTDVCAFLTLINQDLAGSNNGS